MHCARLEPAPEHAGASPSTSGTRMSHAGQSAPSTRTAPARGPAWRCTAWTRAPACAGSTPSAGWSTTRPPARATRATEETPSLHAHSYHRVSLFCSLHILSVKYKHIADGLTQITIMLKIGLSIVFFFRKNRIYIREALKKHLNFDKCRNYSNKNI